MGTKFFRFFALAALTFALTLGAAHAQSYRGEIMVNNDWDDTAYVTMLMERHDEVIRTTWTIHAGQRTFLNRSAGGPRLRVSARDRIKIKSDSRPVAIGDVGDFRDGVWYIRVRDVWQAQRERDRSRRDGYRRDYNRP